MFLLRPEIRKNTSHLFAPRPLPLFVSIAPTKQLHWTQGQKRREKERQQPLRRASDSSQMLKSHGEDLKKGMCDAVGKGCVSSCLGAKLLNRCLQSLALSSSGLLSAVAAADAWVMEPFCLFASHFKPPSLHPVSPSFPPLMLFSNYTPCSTWRLETGVDYVASNYRTHPTVKGAKKRKKETKGRWSLKKKKTHPLLPLITRTDNQEF